ncbi:MAG TPA: OmpA family protein [Thermoanaerobaculia bacterium]|nr:OmpA family protein [Thermoanaerobaculia bacterium]
MTTYNPRTFKALTALCLLLILILGSAAAQAQRSDRVTRRDRTWKGAAIGGAIGAAGAILKGKREADEILAGAAIGGVIGGGIGAYMDRQQERLARIPGTTVERVGDDTLMVHFDSDVLFNVGSSVLDPSGRDTLADVADVINDYPKTAVVVQGHTDSIGSEETNQYLSERRAGTVEEYLANRGVDPGRMSAIGYGESYPAASNDTPSGRQQNRRVDVLLKANAGPLRRR